MAKYRIRNWDRYYENSRTRELKKLEFVLVPNKHDSDGFRTLISKPRGAALFGAWVLILQVASKCEPRGTLVRSDGSPHTAETIARMTGASKAIIADALGVLQSPEVGWIEDAEANEDLETPPSWSASAVDKRRTIGRLDRCLVPSKGVATPKGKVTSRPSECQWCESTPPNSATGMPGIVAHHVIGYGNHVDDLTVIFVCRSCHGLFESGKYTTAMVIEKYGSDWIPRKIVGDSRKVAGDSRLACARTEQKETEGTGREENTSGPVALHQLSPEGWDELTAIALRIGMQMDPDPESAICRSLWRPLSFEQKALRIRGILDRIDCGQYSDPMYVPSLENYLRFKHKETIRPRAGPQRLDRKRAESEKFERRMREEAEYARREVQSG